MSKFGIFINWGRIHVAIQVAQWYRIRPPMQEMQEMQFRPLGGEDPWRRKWQPIPVFLPGKFHEQRGLVGCRVRHNRVCMHTILRILIQV